MCRSRMVRGLTRPLLYVIGVATAVALYETGYEVSWCGDGVGRAWVSNARYMLEDPLLDLGFPPT